MTAGLSSYRDRHGKQRWRLRRGQSTVSLRGQPGEASFDLALARAEAGGAELSALKRRLQKRRIAMAEHYAPGAIRRARTRAIEKNLPFALSKSDFVDLMARQQWACAISGMQFPLEPSLQNRAMDAMRPSLDRVVPSRGYVSGNVRIVCEIVNFAMSNWGPEPLIRIARHLQMANHMANQGGEPIE